MVMIYDTVFVYARGHFSGRSESRANVQGEEAKENSELT